MAKTRAPLGSFSAHGALSKTLTYRTDKGRNIVSGFSKPGSYRQKDPSTSQQARRSLYSQGVSAWHLLDSSEQEEYVLRALSLHLTGFNLFMREFLNNPPDFDFLLLESGDTRLLETGDNRLLE